METDDVLRKVRGLLALAEDDATTPEAAENLNARAAALLAKYGIDQARLAASGKVDDTITRLVITIDNPYKLDKRVLLNAIAETLRCRMCSASIPGGYRSTVVGYQSDLARVELLYTSLLVQAFTQLSRAQVPPGRTPVSYRKAWLLGFIIAVKDRLKAAEQRAAAESAVADEASTGVSTALVLVEREDRVAAALAEMFPEIRKGRTIRRTDSRGYANGKDAGNRADLGNGRVGGRKAAISGG